jgi:hypothetical protein
VGALFRLLTTLVLLVAVVAGIGAFYALSEEPAVTRAAAMTHTDVARAKEILKRNDPRQQPSGAFRTVEMTGKDIDLAVNYLLNRFSETRANIDLTSDRLLARATVRIPDWQWRPYLNLELTLKTDRGEPRVAGSKIGRLPVPNLLSNWLLQYWLDEFAMRSNNLLGHELVQDMQLSDDRLQLTYRWHPAVIEQARETLLGESDREALRFYHDQLVALQAQDIGRRGSLTELMQAMFAAARLRSQAHDPVLENTALLTVLGTWAVHRNLARLVPGDMERPGRFRLKLYGRTDFAQHFAASAALAARGDTALSDAVGLFKEISDSDHGSGFSFTDIAADRAGSRFGELVTASRTIARRMQQRIADGVSEADIMPRVDDLPEHMSSAMFKERFGHVGSPAYHATMEEIERRIAGSALYND